MAPIFSSLADEAWKLLPLYRFDPHSGLWHYESGRRRPSVSLHDIAFDREASGPSHRPSAPREAALGRHLEEARRIIRDVETAPPTGPLHDPVVSSEFERIRWFPLPGEAPIRSRG